VNDVNKEPRLSLGVALRRYWRYLLGVALFPSVAFPAVVLFHVPFTFFILPFIAVMLVACWPCAKKRAPYLFWITAMGVWGGAGAVGVWVTQLLRLVLGILTQ